MSMHYANICMRWFVVLAAAVLCLACSGGSSPAGTESPGAPGSASKASEPNLGDYEKPQLSSEQQAIVTGGTEAAWPAHGLSWTVPAGWKENTVTKESLSYAAADGAYLLVNISILPKSLDMETSLRSNHDQAYQQVKSGKNESARRLALAGIPGVEFVEAEPEKKGDARRHQWIGFRNHNGEKQMINVMTSVRASEFAKHRDGFAAIIYSMRATGGG